jgi:hypothetical protein
MYIYIYIYMCVCVYLVYIWKCLISLVEYTQSKKKYIFWKKFLHINNKHFVSPLHVLLDNLLLEEAKDEEFSSFFYLRPTVT